MLIKLQCIQGASHKKATWYYNVMVGTGRLTVKPKYELSWNTAEDSFLWIVNLRSQIVGERVRVSVALTVL